MTNDNKVVDFDLEKAKKGHIVCCGLTKTQVKFAVEEVVEALKEAGANLEFLYAEENHKLDDSDKANLFEAVNSLPTS